MELKDAVSKAIRDIPDFPQKGVIFKDITPLLSDINLYNEVTDNLATKFKNKNITKVAGLEARGFLFGISVAQKLNVPFIPIRKKGKLPYKTVSADYALEYSTATIEMHEDAISETDNVLIVDDLLATGGTVSAAIELIKKLKGTVAGCAFVTELLFLHGADKLNGIDCYSIVKF